MSVVAFLIWGLLLIAQNFAHTVSQRAKNQENLWYTGTAGVFANGIWIVSNFFMVDEITRITKSGKLLDGVPVVLFYIMCTTFGTVFSQWCAMNVFEKWKVFARKESR